VLQLIEDNMPAHKLFQRPIYLEHLTHESSKAQNLGVPGDPMTFQTKASFSPESATTSSMAVAAAT